MADAFPVSPRASRGVRAAAVVIALAATVLATRTTITSSAWRNRVFPGFMLLDNRVIASVGLASWSGERYDGLYQSQVVSVDGRPVTSTAQIYDIVAKLPADTPVRYTLRTSAGDREVEIPTQLFTVRDWFLLFGPFLLNGLVFLISGLVVWVLRPTVPIARALLAWGAACALFLLTAMDLYRPGDLFRLHVVGEALLPATLIHLALYFPQPHRYARLRFLGYALSLIVLVLYEIFLFDAPAYSRILTTNMNFLGFAGIVASVRIVSAYTSRQSQLARQRVRLMTLGMILGFAFPGVILVYSAVTGGSTAMNPAAFTPFLFALSLAYAVVKHDLFEIDAMVKRTAYYLLLSGVVGGAYLVAVVLFDRVLRTGPLTNSFAFSLLFTLAVLLLFDPLRARLQRIVDRVFFRTPYDTAQLLAAVGRELAVTLQRERLAKLTCDAVEGAVPNGKTRLFVRMGPGDELCDSKNRGSLPQPLSPLLGAGCLVTTFDSAESYPDVATSEAVRCALSSLDAQLAVPLLLRNTLVGAITVGPKRSGLFYTAGDAEFLRALAHQAAIALENARTYEAVAELNAQLEERVRARTAQLEAANHELAETYGELQQAHVQLVQTEKMASLGRLVAGVAHEINNPVSFIVANVTPLRRRLERAAAEAPGHVMPMLRDAEGIVGVMERGAERTAAIVRDLRSFSRLDEAKRKLTDLHEGLEVSLRLLEPRWRDRITVHRDYGTLPPVECDPGQMNQVFMNLLANACDAIGGRGNIWLTTRAVGNDVHITMRDDGAGIPPDVVARVFDPFFTTKDVGTGTGLGLAISHSIVTAHGGRIAVESAAGAGTTFSITLPTALATTTAA